MTLTILLLTLAALWLDEFTSPTNAGAGFMLATARRQRIAAKARQRRRFRSGFYVVMMVMAVLAYFSGL